MCVCVCVRACAVVARKLCTRVNVEKDRNEEVAFSRSQCNRVIKVRLLHCMTRPPND